MPKPKTAKPRKGWLIWVDQPGQRAATCYHGSAGEHLLAEVERLGKLTGARVYVTESIYCREPDGSIVDLSRLP